jgi:hypothetical protein
VGTETGPLRFDMVKKAFSFLFFVAITYVAFMSGFILDVKNARAWKMFGAEIQSHQPTRYIDEEENIVCYTFVLEQPDAVTSAISCLHRK